MSPRPRSATIGAVVCAVVLLAAGCSGAPEVALAPLAAQPECSGLSWPAEIAGGERTTTSPEDPSAAAWGDPPVIARCGLPAPAPTTDSCVDVDGVDWVVRQLTDGTAAVTYGREPALEVLVPEQHGPVPLLLPAFGDAARSLPETGRRCT
jgi:hypothetical protein